MTNGTLSQRRPMRHGLLASISLKTIMFITALLFLSVAADKPLDQEVPSGAAAASDEPEPFNALDETSSPANLELAMDQPDMLDTGIWPFPKNKTKPDKKNHTDNSCFSHKSCSECAASSSTCHWCEHDQACHVIGSIHGCAIGSDCKNHTKPNKKDDKDDKSCAAHKTCSECALSSTLCHWCAHDQACHAVGSIHGCVSGVDCYSNDRCRRTEPEPIKRLVFQQMGLFPMVVIGTLASMCLCCATLGFCIAGGVKGAYDDLAAVAARPDPPTRTTRREIVRVTEEETNNNNETGEESLLVNTEEDGNAHDYSLMGDQDVDEEDGVPLLTQASSHDAFTGSKHMRCLYNFCTVCYIATLAGIATFAIGGIRYFPKRPSYNVCSDEVAWKSLVDSMTSMSVKPTFEILMSVLNPNHFDVDLDMGTGSFKHHDVFVGTFVIPPTRVQAMSISDLMIVATFEPEKWEALALSAEYYRGQLVLKVDSQSVIRIPALANYSFEADFSDMMVHVNEMADRHLCACPSWKDARNKTMFE